MYYFYVGTLLLGILICIVNLGMIITKQERDNHGYLTIVWCVIFLSLMSYLAEIGVGDLAAKMIAIKMELTANAFANAFFLFYILRFCNYKMPNGIRLIVFLSHIICLSFLYTNDYHWLYYSSTTLVPQKDYVGIVITRGPVYFIYMFLHFVHMLVYEGVCISRLRVSHGRDRKIFFRMILVGLAPYLFYLVYALGVTGKFDVTGIGFLVVAILITNTTVHYGFENTVNLAKDRLVDQMGEGFLVTDENGFYIYGNQAALNIFPELSNKEYAKEKVRLHEFLAMKDNKIYRDRHVYECNRITMIDKRKKVGAMYMLHEITEIERLASRDSMTGLYNHKMFYMLLEECIDKCEKQRQKVAIAFIDIDDFKTINDRFGHDNGDMVILELADIMKQYTGDGIYACRYGGEEFAMIFEGSKAVEAKSIMEDIQRTFRGYHFPFCNNEFTFSCAIRHYRYGLGMEEYFAQTDKLLYYIKRNGKKKVLEEAC